MITVSAPWSVAGGDAQPRPLDCNHLEHVHPSPTHEACLAASTSGGGSEGGAARDTFQLTDEPGNWFRSETTRTPVTILDVGGRVDFVAGHETDTEHTATLVIKPVGSRLSVDQDDARNGGVASATFDVPGVYVFLCKVHPYMTGVVAVRDRNGVIPPVTAEQLPFIRHLGVESLPAPAVLDVLTAVAPADADKRAKWDILGPAEGTRPAVSGIGEVWIDTQFEWVPGQVGEEGVAKPGSITVVDAASFSVEREVNGLDPDARGRWNNPHRLPRGLRVVGSLVCWCELSADLDRHIVGQLECSEEGRVRLDPPVGLQHGGVRTQPTIVAHGAVHGDRMCCAHDGQFTVHGECLLRAAN
jgi:plastocyanin